MALKPKKIEIKHIIVTDNMEGLDKYLGDFINSNWIILDARILTADFHNNLFSVFYVLQRNKEINNG